MNPIQASREYERTMKAMQQELLSCWRNPNAGLRHQFARTCLPRRIVPPPGNYESVQGLATRMWLLDRLEHAEPVPNDNNLRLLVWGASLRKHGVTSYYLDREFSRAVAGTQPPPEVTIGDLKLPMPAFVLYPDKNLAREMFGEVVTFVSVLAVEGGSTDLELVSGETTTVELPGESVLQIIYSRTHHQQGIQLPVEGFHQLPKSDKLSECVKLENDDAACERTMQNVESFAKEMGGEVDKLQARDMAMSAAAVSAKVISFTLQLLMVLNTRQDCFITEGACLRLGKQKRATVVDALWSANVIGQGYRSPNHASGSESETDTGGKVRTHWRRGHVHKVLFGPAKSQSRLDWFEPVLVNAPDKEEPNAP